MLINQLKVKLISNQCGVKIISCHLHQQAHKQSQNASSFLPKKHVYQSIYKWKRKDEFGDYLMSRILLNDTKTLAIAKPFGVGIHTPYDKSSDPCKVEPGAFGDPRYCIDDVIDYISEKLIIPELSLAITENRINSGIVLFGKSSELAQSLKKIAFNTKSQLKYPFTYHCLTYGAPLLKDPILEEVVAIRQYIVNENSKEKEPEIIIDPKKSFYTRHKNEVKRVKVQLRVLDYNSALNIARVEIACNKTQYHFVRCYLASKACFILGDPRFSRRVSTILGVPYALKGSAARPVREEPLPKNILKVLDVSSNKSIPLMIHQVKLSLFNYTKNYVLNIDNYNYPEHFIWTMEKLLQAQR